jgi:hypothetical protein
MAKYANKANGVLKHKLLLIFNNRFRRNDYCNICILDNKSFISATNAYQKVLLG